MTGYTASLMMVPDRRLAVIILVNRDGAVLGRTQEKALEMFAPLGPKTALPVGETETRNLIGVYEQPKRWRSEVVIKDGRLFIEQVGREMPLTKIGEDRYSYQFPTPENTQEVMF